MDKWISACIFGIVLCGLVLLGKTALIFPLMIIAIVALLILGVVLYIMELRWHKIK